jgi:hypothetical protein
MLSGKKAREVGVEMQQCTAENGGEMSVREWGVGKEIRFAEVGEQDRRRMTHADGNTTQPRSSSAWPAGQCGEQ